ncbi:MAG: fused MFS/spermidine synthase, partial [Candidatus Omnitrophota bacterium]
MKKFKSHHQEQSSFKKMTIAYCTAFIAGFCVMVIEIVAGRLIARFLGVSLYTWTSVIGVVLAGISLGYYVGGRIADRYPPQITLSKLFIAASITCLLVPVLNNLMGAFPIVLRLSWPVRITLHVAILFFLPSTFLGMISPVVAKFALDQGLGTGRTIGNIYACGSGGSIAGTIVAGFFLIASMGSVAVIWTIAGILTAVGVFYSKRGRLAYAWLTVFAFLVFVSFSDAAWAKTMAVGLFLSEPRQEELVYAKDSQYSYIRILENTKKPGICEFKLDNLVQTKMKIGEPANLKYAYGCHRIFGGIVRNPNFNKEDLSVLHLGGGGYLFPRYVEKVFPKSRNEVIEIDPEATKAAIKAFGLSEESGIVIHHSDVRNYVEDLLRRKRRGEDIQLFDLIYCDVFLGGVAVPYHLVTYEINQKIALLLKPGGRY